MPNRILFPEFRDELEFTRYPFADTATLLSGDSQQAIDKDTFLDASLYPIGALEQVHIASIVVAPQAVTINLGDRRNTAIASGVFDPLDPPEAIEFTDRFGRPAGVLVSEPLRLARFSAWESRTHTFGPLAAEFVAGCVIPTPEPGLRGILTPDGDLVVGDVWLVGENGVVVRQDGDCVIRVDVVGDPLFVRRLCAPTDLFTTPNFLRTINDCPPNEFGEYRLEVGNDIAPDTVLRIVPVNDGLKIEAVGQLVRDEG
jgi:hypothetical protein